MTQKLTKSTLPLRLVAMRLPETMDWIRRSPKSSLASEPEPNVLCLTPGMVSEIAIELENSGSQPISWTLEMTGNFPTRWYYPATDHSDENGESSESIIPSTSYQDDGMIQPRDRLHPSIRLHIPEDFFEDQNALYHQESLELNYQGEIYLFANWQGQQRLAGYQSLRIEVRPDSIYMTLLPEIFQSEDFMARFLSIFERTFDPSLQMLSMLKAYLDPMTAPRSMLPFLSKWVAWDIDPRWSLKQQRRLIRYAIELYRWRGTRRGVQYYLHLYTGLPLDEELPEAEKHISITDETQRAFVFGQARFGEYPASGVFQLSTAPMIWSLLQADTCLSGVLFLRDQLEIHKPSAFGGGNPFHFNVILRPDRPDQIDETSVQQVIEQVKPAFCTYALTVEIAQSSSDDVETTEALLYANV